MNGLRALALVCGCGGLIALGPALADPVSIGGSILEPVPWDHVSGFPGSDIATAFTHFRTVCTNTPSSAVSYPVPALAKNLTEVCGRSKNVDATDAASFFTNQFNAFRVVRFSSGDQHKRRTGILTGYFEPELDGSLEKTALYGTPVLGRPNDLVTFQPGEVPPDIDPTLRAARRVNERWEAYPNRAAIEDGALVDRAKPLLYLRDAVDLFVLQVQGSGRVRLPDSKSVRVLYDGRNGQPYSSVAKLIVAEGHLPLEGLTLARWTQWLRDHPLDGTRLMRANASYIFFRLEEMKDPTLGPVGASGSALIPGRSLAVDATLWPYGLPFWLESRVPEGLETESGRMVIAADTGSAIVGPARGDLFVGTGAEAGVIAGDLRSAVGFIVLLPKPSMAQ